MDYPHFASESAKSPSGTSSEFYQHFPNYFLTQIVLNIINTVLMLYLRKISPELVLFWVLSWGYLILNSTSTKLALLPWSPVKLRNILCDSCKYFQAYLRRALVEKYNLLICYNYYN